MTIAEQSATLQGGARATGPLRRTVLAVVIALVVGGFVGRFVFLTPAGDTVAADASGGARDLAAARAALSADPDDPALLVNVGNAALDEARRTADPALYAEADDAVSKALRAARDDIRALVPAGLLALARHDFTGALELAQQARAIAPLAVDPLAVEIDALVELGRYDEALEQANLMVSRRPNVTSLSRLSYVLELRGDPDGALETMQQAVAAGGRRADGAYVLALLGDLHLQSGRLDAAASAYDRSLASQPGQPQAELGAARVLAYRGDLPAAAERLAKLTDRVPLPDAVALYADVLAASGDEAAAAEQRGLVRAIEELNRSEGGISVDLELARFEADHARLPGGDPAAAVRLAEAARAARPTIFGDDILGWALRQAGRPDDALPHARAATRLGTADATLWFHLAAIEADLGQLDDARDHLERSRAISPHLPLVERDEAAALATRLGLAAPGPR
ncbi:MAG TPA: tetratricopeptide repeat protein [Acidimicrobiales bacterium]|nr:tetratricopeptide repeat protein [Acidimicrobiales bacterium]